MKKLLTLFAMLLIIAMSMWAASCTNNSNDDDDDDDTSGDDDTGDNDDDDDDDDTECPEPNLDISVCALDAGPFSLTIDNEFFPLAVGDQLILEGDDEGVMVRVEIDVLDEIKDIDGVETRVVTEHEYEDDGLIEISWNWFAQAADGTVCYFGEEVDIYEDGEVVSHDGAWEAGVNGAQAGIMMPGDPQIGDAGYQEFYEGNAQDMFEITGFGAEITVPAGTFDDTLSVTDYNPLEGCESDDKVYVAGIGLSVDGAVELISY